jgi:hypothetical protein
MFGLFKHKSRETIEEYREAGESLGVFTLTLVNVEDPFDPDPLWDRRYGGNPRIAEQRTGDGDFRLQSALDGCRDIKHVRDAEGRFRETTPVFTDIVVWLPEAKWRADAKRRGQRLEALASNLAQLHQSKFRRSLPQDRDPVYTVMPDPNLEANSVVFQFGFGVFVPSPDDELLGNICLKRSKDGEPVKFEDWSFWRAGAQVKRPIGVYAGQGSILITPDASGPVRAPLWFGQATGGNVSLNLSAADAERVYTDIEHVRVAEQVIPKRDSEAFQWVLKDTRGEGEDNTLVVEVKFVSEPATRRALNLPPPAPPKPPPPPPKPVPPPAPAKPPPRAKEKEREKERARERAPRPEPAQQQRATGLGRFFGAAKVQDEAPATVAPTRDDSSAPAQAPISQRFSLKLTGCALLRIDGERRLPGLEQWTIWFDRIGRPVRRSDKDSVDTRRCLALSARADSPHLFYRLPKQSDFSPVRHMPSSLETDSGKYLELVPTPVPEAYHGLLLLRQEQTLPLSAAIFLLGRSDSAAEGAQPDLPMELLDHPEALRWAEGHGHKGAKLNALNLSRRHVALRLVGNKLEVAMADGQMPCYVLNAEGALIKTLMPRERGSVLMSPDEFFIVGGYALRFHQEKLQAMSSRDATVMRARAREPGLAR